MPLQDANPTPSFGGFGFRRWIWGAAVADERSQQPVLGEVANIADKLVSQSPVSQTASTTC